jgi:hypothetical protein
MNSLTAWLMTICKGSYELASQVFSMDPLYLQLTLEEEFADTGLEDE